MGPQQFQLVAAIFATSLMVNPTITSKQLIQDHTWSM